jgi:hypothetical protein
LQAKVTKDFGDFTFLGSYEWYKTLADMIIPCGCGQQFGSQGMLAQHLAIRSTGKSLAANGGTPPAGQVVKVMYAYDLPLGRGKRFGANANGITNGLISGWRFSGIHLYQPGPVVRVTSPQSIPGIGAIWPVRVPDVPVKVTGCGSSDPGNPNSRYLNTNAFQAAAPFTLGNAYTLPDVLGCPYLNEDFGIDKATSISERWKLRIGVMAHNILNRHQFGGLRTDISQPSTFGRFTNASDARTIQLYGRIEF